jgi:dynein heavy chain
MRLNCTKEEVTWEPVEVNGELPPARSQHVAISMPKGDKVFIFGGHHNATTRLNDSWWYTDKDSEFRRIGDEEAVKLDNSASTIGAPDPRANMGSCLYKNKIYINGGHGGIGYARTAFQDLFCFDCETEKWENLETVSEKLPPGRGGHSLFGYEDKIYVYGGWNSEMHFNNMLCFDLETKEWNDCDLVFGVPRWNHCSFLVEAIPNYSYKFFIFGGESAAYTEGAARAFGEYVNSSAYLEVDKMNWEIFASDPDVFSNMPSPREYAAMAYQQTERTLVLFGGWSNGWHNDVYTLNVAKVVGPPYAITGSEPSMGQLSGGNTLRIFGKNFTDSAEIGVFFTAGQKTIDHTNIEKLKNTVRKLGTRVSDNEITVETPDMSIYDSGTGAECVVQLALGTQDITTSYVNFNYYLNTRAYKSLCYGPGVLDQVVAGAPVEFVIQARNDKEENRESGKDVFEVQVSR